MKLHKSVRNRMWMGVCGGLGETFHINPNIIRILFVLLHVLTRMPLFLLYLLMGFMLPYGEPEERNSGEGTFGGFERGQSSDYAPEAPPFDVSNAKDVEIDDKK